MSYGSNAQRDWAIWGLDPSVSAESAGLWKPKENLLSENCDTKFHIKQELLSYWRHEQQPR